MLPVMLIVYPALIEESIFRGLLHPRSLFSVTPLCRFAAVTLSTAAFVPIHPLNALVFQLSDTSEFLEPSFLYIVAALWYACGYSYLRSGSLWAPIGIHWATVVAWNLFLGRSFGA